MDLWLSILMGFVQGAAEFLPISSSGHLAVMHSLFGDLFSAVTPQEELLFDVLLHVSTLAAVLIAFWKDIRSLLWAFFTLFTRKGRADRTAIPPRRLILLLGTATLPLLLVLLFNDAVEALMQNMVFVGSALIVTGILLFIADRVKPGRKTEKSALVTDALLVGLAQVAATFPGISRSGTTITAGLLRGYDRSFAVRFSFLMSIPAVVAAAILKVSEAVESGVEPALIVSFLPGMLTAFVVGYISIILLRLLVAKGRFGIFAYYCSVVGAAVLLITLFSHNAW